MKTSFAYARASALSNAGSYLHYMAMGWLLYHLHGDALFLPVLGMIRVLVDLAFGSVGGLTVQKASSRRMLLVLTNALHGALSVALALLVANGAITTSLLVAQAVLGAAVSVFAVPAQTALMKDICADSAERERANTTLLAWFFALRVVVISSVALTTVLLGEVRELAGAEVVAVIFAADAISYWLLSALLLYMPEPSRRTENGGLKEAASSLLQRVRQFGKAWASGIEPVRRERGVLWLLLLEASIATFSFSAHLFLFPIIGDMPGAPVCAIWVVLACGSVGGTIGVKVIKTSPATLWLSCFLGSMVSALIAISPNYILVALLFGLGGFTAGPKLKAFQHVIQGLEDNALIKSVERLILGMSPFIWAILLSVVRYTPVSNEGMLVITSLAALACTGILFLVGRHEVAKTMKKALSDR